MPELAIPYDGSTSTSFTDLENMDRVDRSSVVEKIRGVGNKLRAIAHSLRRSKDNGVIVTTEEVMPSEKTIQDQTVSEATTDRGLLLSRISEMLAQAEQMLKDPSKIISSDTRERIQEAVLYIQSHGEMSSMPDGVLQQAQVLLQIVALSYRHDLQIHSIHPSISASGISITNVESSLLGSRATLGEAMSIHDVELPFSITFSESEQLEYNERERLAALRLISTIFENSKNLKLYKTSEKGNLVLTSQGKSQEYAAIYEMIADLDIELPHSFGNDRMRQVIALAESKLRDHIPEFASPEKVVDLLGEKEIIYNDVVHIATLTRLCLDDPDYRRWVRGMKTEEVQMVRTAHQDERVGTATGHDQLPAHLVTKLEEYRTLYSKKERGVLRRNTKGGNIIVQSSVDEDDASPLYVQSERSLFEGASNRIKEIEKRMHTAHQHRMLEGISERYNEVRNMERMEELKRAIRVKTGETNPLQLYRIAKERLESEMRIAKALNLDDSSLSTADKKRIITRVFDTWGVVEKDVANRLLHEWDGRGNPPVTLTATGELTRSSHDQIFEEVTKEIVEALHQLGIETASSQLPSLLESKGKQLYETQLNERSMRIYANMVRARARLESVISQTVCSALRAREERTILSFPQTSAEIRASKPRLISRLQEAERISLDRINRFMGSNKALQSLTVLRGILMLPALTASGAHFVQEAMGAIDLTHLDQLIHDADHTLHAFEHLIQQEVVHQITEIASDRLGFGIEHRFETVQHPFVDTIQHVVGTRTVVGTEPVGPLSGMQDIPQAVIDRCLTTIDVPMGQGEHGKVLVYNPEAVKDGICQTEFPGMEFALGPGHDKYLTTYPQELIIPNGVQIHPTAEGLALNPQKGNTCFISALTSIINHIRESRGLPLFSTWVFSDIAQPGGEHASPIITDSLEDKQEIRSDPNSIPAIAIDSFNAVFIDPAGLADKFGISYHTQSFNDLWNNLRGEDREQYIMNHTQEIAKAIAERYEGELNAQRIPIHSQYVSEGVGHATVVLGTMHDTESDRYSIVIAEPNGGYTGWKYTRGIWKGSSSSNGVVVVPLTADTIEQMKTALSSFGIAQPEDLVHEVEYQVASVQHIPDFETGQSVVEKEFIKIPFVDIAIPTSIFDGTN